MGEWLSQRFAKPSFRNGRVGSNPTTSAIDIHYCIIHNDTMMRW